MLQASGPSWLQEMCAVIILKIFYLVNQNLKNSFVFIDGIIVVKSLKLDTMLISYDKFFWHWSQDNDHLVTRIGYEVNYSQMVMKISILRSSPMFALHYGNVIFEVHS
jgi:hypothetical protein